jgi:AhpD family alkylhydroperoxidase
MGRFGRSVDVMTTTTNSTVQIPARLAPKNLTPASYRAMIGLDGAAAAASIETPLQELVRIRASQLNGCVYCLDMHTTDARRAGESEQRIYALSAWPESSLFTARERAALRFTEAVTLVADGHVPDDAYAAAAAEFSEVELAELLWTIIVINAWNRLAIAARLVPGT